MNCSACNEEGIYEGGTFYDGAPRYWCHTHFAAADLMQWGREYKWRPFEYPAEEGFTGKEMEPVQPGKVYGGQEEYVNFVREHTKAEVWVAMMWCRLLVKGETELYWKAKQREEKAQQEKENEQRKLHGPANEADRCSRYAGGCRRRWDVPVRHFWQRKKDKQGNEIPNGPFLYPEWQGREQILDVYTFHWCAECGLCGLLLDLGDVLDYPAFSYSTVHLQAGQKAWVAFATQSDYFSVVEIFDELRRCYSHEWSLLRAA